MFTIANASPNGLPLTRSVNAFVKSGLQNSISVLFMPISLSLPYCVSVRYAQFATLRYLARNQGLKHQVARIMEGIQCSQTPIFIFAPLLLLLFFFLLQLGLVKNYSGILSFLYRLCSVEEEKIV